MGTISTLGVRAIVILTEFSKTGFETEKHWNKHSEEQYLKKPVAPCLLHLVLESLLYWTIIWYCRSKFSYFSIFQFIAFQRKPTVNLKALKVSYSFRCPIFFVIGHWLWAIPDRIYSPSLKWFLILKVIVSDVWSQNLFCNFQGNITFNFESLTC